MNDGTKMNVCTSSLYTLKAYSDVFGIKYSTVYSRQLLTKLGSEQISEEKKIRTISVNGAELIYVTPEEKERLLREKEIRDKKSMV